MCVSQSIKTLPVHTEYQPLGEIMIGVYSRTREQEVKKAD